MKPKLILIAGPTASGKSALALQLARARNGAIINADSMQIYAGLPILTAQPSPQEQSQVPHTLYGVIDAAEAFSVAKWLASAEREIAASHALGQTPILVGGTGLYFKALLQGLAEIPAVPPDVRAVVQTMYDEIGEPDFRAKLAAIDPLSAERLEANDRQRLIRAYEVAHHTGKPLSYWQEQAAPNAPATRYDIEAKLVMPPRDKLYAQCDARFAMMMERGAMDEARALLARNLNSDLPAMKILGIPELASYLRGEISLAQAITDAQQATRNYAKRQMTWFRNQWRDMQNVETIEKT